MTQFDLLAFDADDTLWHNEQLYLDAQSQFRALLVHYHSPEWIDARLYEAEMRNLPHFGYGIKAFALTMIETAIELTEGRIAARDLQTLIELAKTMLTAEVKLLDHVADTLTHLAQTHTLMVITKGDLLDQEAKINRSGLAAHFRHIEVVSHKNPQTYGELLKRYGLAPEQFLMVGNSMRSDILPVLALGAHAVYIPHPLTWAHEVSDPPPAGQAGYYELEHIGLLPQLLAKLASVSELSASAAKST